MQKSSKCPAINYRRVKQIFLLFFTVDINCDLSLSIVECVLHIDVVGRVLRNSEQKITKAISNGIGMACY